ncbi:MAG: menaquinone biosynthesis protein [Acidobacteriia bacterium]|nr:menaquinone biosynthesis protein [Terriglobia bacterium]
MPLPKVSVVQYLNSVPLIWGMVRGEQQGRYDLAYTIPAACADAVHQGKADIGIVPSIEYQRIERAQILSGLSIASKSEAKSVLLLSNVPIEKVKTIAVDNSSRTSAALVRILMRKFYSRFITVAPSLPKPADMLKRADAALVIGDPALTFNGQVACVYDLAAEWRKFTGLPFVFALWVGRESARLARFRKDFEDSRSFGLAHVDEIAVEYAAKLHLQPAAVKVYLTENIDYSLDEENRKGLRLFFKLAREAGIIPIEKDLLFV